MNYYEVEHFFANECSDWYKGDQQKIDQCNLGYSSGKRTICYTNNPKSCLNVEDESEICSACVAGGDQAEEDINNNKFIL